MVLDIFRVLVTANSYFSLYSQRQLWVYICFYFYVNFSYAALEVD